MRHALYELGGGILAGFGVYRSQGQQELESFRSIQNSAKVILTLGHADVIRLFRTVELLIPGGGSRLAELGPMLRCQQIEKRARADGVANLSAIPATYPVIS
jgi:hypothetical protein